MMRTSISTRLCSAALISAFAALPAAAAPGDAPVITCSSGSFPFVVTGTALPVDAELTVTGTDPISGAIVLLSNKQTGDTLTFDSAALPSGVTGAYNSTTGALTFTGSASTANWQTLLRTVKLTVTANTSSTRSVTFTLSGALAFSDNGHYYEFVSSSGISWTDANTAANARTLYGLQGYLVTVTSSAENAFVAGKLAGQGWMGATDATAEGDWRWVTGPEGLENSAAGRAFTQQTSACSSSPNRVPVYGGATSGGGTAVGGNYNNWSGGEPNDCYGSVGEDYAHFLANGAWNDYPVSIGGAIQGYVVEYGGMPGDPTVQISSTRNGSQGITLTYTTDGHGTISGSATQYIAFGGTGTAVTATPSAGYAFLKWSDNSTTNPRTDAHIYTDTTIQAIFTFVGAPNLVVTVESDKQALIVGEQVTFNVKVENTGNASADNMSVTIPLPDGTEYVSAKMVTNADSAQVLEPTVTVENGNVVLTYASLPEGEQTFIELILKALAKGGISVTAEAATGGQAAQATGQTAADVAVEDRVVRIVLSRQVCGLGGATGLIGTLCLMPLVIRRRRK